MKPVIPFPSKISLKINELSNETRELPLDFQQKELPKILKSTQTQEKLKMLETYLKDQKEEYKAYMGRRKREIKDVRKKEERMIKKNMSEWESKHDKVFKSRVHCPDEFSTSEYFFDTGKSTDTYSKNTTKVRLNSLNGPWSQPNTRSDFFDEYSVYRKDKKIEENINSTLTKFQKKVNKQERDKKLWASNPLWKYSVLPNEELDQYDLDNYTVKTKWPDVRSRVPFKPSSFYGDYFEKPISKISSNL